MFRKCLGPLPLFKILVVVIAVASSVNVHDKSYLLPEILQHFCVGGNVCPTNNSYDVLTYSEEDGPCCSDCSCAVDCDQDNCCFTRDRQNTEPIDRSNQQCLYTTAKTPEKDEQHLYPAYYIVTQAPVDGCKPDADDNANANIGQDTDQPHINVPDRGPGVTLGELYPVYSPSAHNIFTNLSLAQCYGARDVIPWTPVMTCQKMSKAFPEHLMDPSSHALALLDPKEYPFCETSFYYPGNRSDILSERCYHDMVDTCDNSSTIHVPFGTSMNAEEIAAACESDYYSPYLLQGNFANVFCYVCSGNVFSKYKTCPRKAFRNDGQSFTWLLKPNVGRTIKSLDEERKSSKDACSTSNVSENDCRTIHCPTGHLRTSNNTCVWPFTASGNTTYELYVQMTSTSQPISSDDIEKYMGPPGENHFPANFKHHWAPPWEVKFIWYIPKSSQTQSKSVEMLVALLQANSGDAFETILKSVTDTLPTYWKLRRGNNDIYFEQGFSFSTIKTVSFFGTPAIYVFTNISRAQIELRQPTVIYKAGEFYRTALRLSKLYFCEQIELDQDELIFDGGKSCLTSKLSDRKYLDAEFAILENKWKQTKARVCLSDSMFMKRVKGGKGSDGVGLHLYSWWTPLATFAFVVLLF